MHVFKIALLLLMSVETFLHQEKVFSFLTSKKRYKKLFNLMEAFFT